MFDTMFFSLTLLLLPFWGANPVPVSRYDSCPTVTVSCPEDICGCGPEYIFVAQVSGADPAVVLTYKWTISTGEIVEGQNTYRIKVDARGAQTNAITVNVEIGGWDEGCPSKASVNLMWNSPLSPPNNGMHPTANQLAFMRKTPCQMR